MRARSLQIIFLLICWTLLVIAAVVIISASFQPTEGNGDTRVRLDEQLPWCFEPDTGWVINLDDDAEVDECVLTWLTVDKAGREHRDTLRTVYSQKLEDMTEEEREKAIRERTTRYLHWKGEHQ